MMLLRRTLLAAAVCFTRMPWAFSAAYADSVTPSTSRAPFGLSWDMSADEVRKLGVELAPQPSNTSVGTAYLATKLPKVLADAENVLLGFGFDDRLFTVHAVGSTNASDPYGGKTLDRYRELASSLEAHYGEGRETDTRDTSLWKEPSEYIMSIKAGRAFRYTEFKSGGTSVELSVRALDTDSSYWVVIFDSDAGRSRFENASKKKEQDTL